MLCLVCIGVFLNFLQRMILSSAIIPMSGSMGWDKQQQGFVLQAFFWGYVSTQIIGGSVADYSAKEVLTVSVVGSALLGAATPSTTLHSGLWGLIVVRVAMGLVQGAMYPSIHSLVSRHIPPSSMSVASALPHSALYVGLVSAFFITPLVGGKKGEVVPPAAADTGSSWLQTWFPEWSLPFFLFSAATLLWLPFWTGLSLGGKESTSDAAKSEIRDGLSVRVRGLSESTRTCAESSSSKVQEDNSPTEVNRLKSDDELMSPQPVPSVPSEDAISPPLPTRPHMDSQDSPAAADDSPRKGERTGLLSLDAPKLPVRERKDSPKRPPRTLPVQARLKAAMEGKRERPPAQKAAKHTWRYTLRMWFALLSYRSVWALLGCHYAVCGPRIALMTWAPSFINDRFSVSDAELGFFSSLPYVAMAVASAFAGLLADMMIRKGWRVIHVRRFIQAVSMLTAALAILGLAYEAASPLVATLFLTLATGSDALGYGALNVMHLDMAPTMAGLLYGTSNTFCNLGGIVSVPTVGWLLRKGEEAGMAVGDRWRWVFFMCIAHYLIGVVWWLWASSDERIDTALEARLRKQHSGADERDASGGGTAAVKEGHHGAESGSSSV
ncbi:unnamed protein product [Vitrella brassicaformis CCMP3155]|uniref:Major facilitator superfamily (MFS) profile domain-containing protein n=1 Tax=Vitrella brassicaformis (strain CCMP3155) TaxID=1169540 RepID=A0A0G4GBQ1_VITBC|nr:unnamed protein product [Vitrella brassicaformis CCMP3155]|eukprot:CEM26525.1 unnamed protein product [Vitrella brassicaformis CCMP3155]